MRQSGQPGEPMDRWEAELLVRYALALREVNVAAAAAREWVNRRSGQLVRRYREQAGTLRVVR